MSLQEVYQAIILEHNENPQNYGQISTATHNANGHNPICGDDISVFIGKKGDKIESLAFVSEGCAICKASGSLMTATLKGLNCEEAAEKAIKIIAWLNGEDNAPQPSLGDVDALAGVKQFPARIKCATLAWHTFLKALNGDGADKVCATGSCCCRKGCGCS